MIRTRIAAMLMLAGPATGEAMAQATPRVTVDAGALAGVAGADGADRFLGIPFAAAPVGDRRWREPRPVARWRGVRPATGFGARCMQLPLYSDMAFRSPAGSEDCLYLNVWMPAGRPKNGQRLPVLFYIHGGGFQAGDGSEKRYDGAARGMVVVSANHRLGLFGFLAHPALTAESRYRASGNYGLLDQAAALDWVARNIAAFGGDPTHVTIGGESAGSMSVSALMASPLSRRRIVGAIGESGAMMGQVGAVPRAVAEAQGIALGPLATLRATPADALLATQGAATTRFGPDIDGHMLVESVEATFAAGRQARVPLLVGTNSQEAGYQAVLGGDPATVAGWQTALARLYGARAGQVAALYPVAGDADVIPVATALASDRFLGWPTWRWFDMHRRSGAATFLYDYRRVRPRALGDVSGRALPWGAVHSAEIEYALGNLDANPAYAWTDDDRRVSQVMSGYWAAFVKTGDPNAGGLPRWPAAPAGAEQIQRQVIDVDTAARPFPDQARYIAMTPLK